MEAINSQGNKIILCEIARWVIDNYPNLVLVYHKITSVEDVPFLKKVVTHADKPIDTDSQQSPNISSPIHAVSPTPSVDRTESQKTNDITIEEPTAVIQMDINAPEPARSDTKSDESNVTITDTNIAPPSTEIIVHNDAELDAPKQIHVDESTDMNVESNNHKAANINISILPLQSSPSPIHVSQQIDNVEKPAGTLHTPFARIIDFEFNNDDDVIDEDNNTNSSIASEEDIAALPQIIASIDKEIPKLDNDVKRVIAQDRSPISSPRIPPHDNRHTRNDIQENINPNYNSGYNIDKDMISKLQSDLILAQQKNEVITQEFRSYQNDREREIIQMEEKYINDINQLTSKISEYEKICSEQTLELNRKEITITSLKNDIKAGENALKKFTDSMQSGRDNPRIKELEMTLDATESTLKGVVSAFSMDSLKILDVYKTQCRAYLTTVDCVAELFANAHQMLASAPLRTANYASAHTVNPSNPNGSKKQTTQSAVGSASNTKTTSKRATASNRMARATATRHDEQQQQQFQIQQQQQQQQHAQLMQAQIQEKHPDSMVSQNYAQQSPSVQNIYGYSNPTALPFQFPMDNNQQSNIITNIEIDANHMSNSSNSAIPLMDNGGDFLGFSINNHELGDINDGSWENDSSIASLY